MTAHVESPAQASPLASVASVSARRQGLARVTLTNFRSYEAAQMRFDGRPAALSGPNGAGKTNLLEAISLLSPGRGLRGAKQVDLARREGDGGWAVAAQLCGQVGETALGTGVTPGGAARRTVRIDGETASGASQLAGHLRILWLTPAMDRLFMDGAGERRKFLDRLTLAYEPAHAASSTAYAKALRERQALLERGEMDDAWLTALEGAMAEHGVALAAARRDMTARLAAAMADGPQEIFPRPEISLSGFLEEALAQAPAADVEDAFAARLKAMRGRDAKAGRALDGPHRSDLLAVHPQRRCEARLCSTGEQKTLLLGLVLAHARLLAQTDGPPLVLLLDEVAAHLDAERRAALFRELTDLSCHSFMTGTDEAIFAPLGDDAQHLRIGGPDPSFDDLADAGFAPHG